MIGNLSVVVLSLNEAARIGRCVESLSFAKSVVIVDSYSADGTLEAAAAAWARTGREERDLLRVQCEWQGFTRARNASLAWVKTAWVLWVDADEWVTPELAAELAQLCDNEAPEMAAADVYMMPRLSRFLGREIRHGGWYPDRKARLGRVGRCEWRSGPNASDVHEDLWPASGKRSLLRGHLGHEPFLSREEQRQTNLRYSGLLADGLARKRRESRQGPPPEWLILIKTGIKFLENYVFKRGFLDGQQGLLIALGSAQSLAWRLRKVRALMLNAPGSQDPA